MIVAIVTIGGAVALLRTRRRASGYRRAGNWAMRTGLPFDPAPLRRSVLRRFRDLEVADAGAALAAAAMSAAAYATPVGDSLLFVVVVVLPSYVLTSLVGVLAVTLRERLFHPAPDVPRVARARAMQTSDYLGPRRRAATWVVGVATVVLLAALWVAAARGSLAPDATSTAVAASVVIVISLLLCVSLPFIDDVILAQPQPASDTIELAWDDALRANALSCIRLAVAVVGVAGVTLAASALWPDPTSAFGQAQIVMWGQLILQLIYPPQGFALRPALRPTATFAPIGVSA